MGMPRPVSKRGKAAIVRLIGLRLCMLGVFLFLGMATYNQFSQPASMQITQTRYADGKERTLHYSPIIGELYTDLKSSLRVSLPEYISAHCVTLQCASIAYYVIIFTLYDPYNHSTRIVVITDCHGIDEVCSPQAARDAQLAERAFSVWDVPVLEIG